MRRKINVKKAYSMYVEGCSYKEIAKRFNCHPTYIGKVLRKEKKDRPPIEFKEVSYVPETNSKKETISITRISNKDITVTQVIIPNNSETLKAILNEWR